MVEVFKSGVPWSRQDEAWIDWRTHLQCKKACGLFHGSWSFTRETFVAVGGYRWHSQTENNPSEHTNHRQAYDTTSDKVDTGQEGTEQAWDASPASTSWTSGIDYLLGGSGDLTGHLGPYNSGDDTDNRPPYPVVAFIERWK